VAVVTIDAAGNVVGILAGRDDAVVTGATSTNYVGMIDSECGRERIRCVAILTGVRGQDVALILAGRVGTVVA